VRQVDEKGLEEMMAQVVAEAIKCASAKADVIVQCGSPGVFLKGVGYDQQVIDAMQKATGVKSTTMMTAMVEGLRAVGAKRIALGSTYVEHVNAKMKAYLEALGFTVLAVEGLEQLYPDQCIDLEPDVSYQLGKRVFEKSGGAEAVLLSCAGMQTFACHAALETQTGVPVITSNQASLWLALRMAGIPDKIPSLGQLLVAH